MYDSTKVQMKVTGKGDVTILFVHGIGCGGEDWDAQVSALSQRHRCVTLDLPGHGSSMPPEQTNMGAMAAAVNFAKEASGGRKFVLVGHSLGSRIIREAVRRSPIGVLGLVHVDGSIFVGDRDYVLTDMPAEIDAQGFERFVSAMFDGMFFEKRDLHLLEKLTARALKLDPDFGRDLLKSALLWDLECGRQTLNQNVPAMAIQSTFYSSPQVRAPMRPNIKTPFMDLLEQEGSQCEVRVITDTGHFPMIEAPDLVNHFIINFVETVSVQTRGLP